MKKAWLYPSESTQIITLYTSQVSEDLGEGGL